MTPLTDSLHSLVQSITNWKFHLLAWSRNVKITTTLSLFILKSSIHYPLSFQGFVPFVLSDLMLNPNIHLARDEWHELLNKKGKSGWRSQCFCSINFFEYFLYFCNTNIYFTDKRYEHNLCGDNASWQLFSYYKPEQLQCNFRL